jgi:hypothetical protein
VSTQSALNSSLIDSYRGLVVGGRWLLVVAATIETIIVAATEQLAFGAMAALLAFFLYNVATLGVVHWIPIRRVPVPLILALDMAFTAVAAYYTGGSRSVFLGQYYLIIFAGGLFFGLRGGLVCGAAAALIAVVLTQQHPESIWADLRDVVPYFLISGAFTGYLVSQMRTWFERYNNSLASRRAQDLEAERVRSEMALARVMQEAALPASVPIVPGVQLASRHEFAGAVGGDFYLYLPGERQLGLLVGDVSGKGMPAALVATSAAHLIPWLAPLDNPARALSHLNRDLGARLPPDAFVTLVLATIDCSADRIRVWSAGHPPAVLWRAREQRVLEGQVFNPLLGILDDWTAAFEEWPFEADDVLVLYSDGLSEVRNAAGEMFDTAGVGAVLAAHAHETPEQLADRLVRAATGWGTVVDDLTVMVCRRAR